MKNIQEFDAMEVIIRDTEVVQEKREKRWMSLSSNYLLLNLRNDKQFEYDALEWQAGSRWKDLVGHSSYLMRDVFVLFCL